MLKSILIGKFIYDRLKDLCDGRVYPLVCTSDTTFPYCVYRKSDISSIVCKDGLYQDNISFTVMVADINYDTGCEIAQQIRERLTIPRLDFTDGQRLQNCRLVSIDESFQDSAFVQTLIFECQISL